MSWMNEGRGPTLRVWFLAAGLFCTGAAAWAHKSSDAYLRVSPSPSEPSVAAVQNGEVALQLSLALKDVDASLDTLDANDDRQLTWGEVRQAIPAVTRWVAEGVRWTCGDRAVDPTWSFDALEQRSDGRYVRVNALVVCPEQQALAVDYQLLRGIDPTHRLLVSGNLGGKSLALVLAPDGRSNTLLRAEASAQAAPEASPIRDGWATLLHFISEGVSHILEGYDHLAFLLALLLPISLLAGDRSRPVPQGFNQAQGRWDGVLKLLTTVTCFTVGHSITLALAGLGWISASASWVEPVIAMSIGVSALLNLYPIKGIKGGALALGFGLIHGLGFSGALLEAGIADGQLVWALAGFNLGVEAGQLMVVALWCAVSMGLSNWSGYQRFVVKGGSVGLALLSLYWTVQRVALSP